jgi:putative FmdB family regulatory protein
MPLYLYGCPADHFKESIRSISDRDRPQKCQTCGQKATRMVTTVGIRLDPFTGDFPSATARWEHLHHEKLAWETKHERGEDEYK